MKSNCCHATLEIGGGTHSTRWFLCSKFGKACDANPCPWCSLCGEEPHTLGECPNGWEKEKLMKARRELVDEVARLRSAILQTIEENLHLADGDNCTLWRLVHAAKTKEKE